MIPIAVVLQILPIWYKNLFGEVTFDQVFFHLNTKMGDAVPDSIFQSAIILFILFPCCVFLIIFFALKHFKKINIKIYVVTIALGLITSVIVSVVALKNIYTALEVDDFLLTDSADADWMSGLYIKPQVDANLTKNPKNLMLIYLESMENRFVSPETELAKIAKKHTYAKNFKAFAGSQWTIAAMMSSQCSVPLLPIGMLFHDSDKGQIRPLKNTYCMGNILKEMGYTNMFIGGADKQFAYKGPFLATHGFDPVLGKHEIIKLYPSILYDAKWWGIYDSDLFDLAKIKIKELENNKTLFTLSMLTLDTHSPGILSPHCKNQGYKNETESIIQCSVQQVGDFLQWFLQQPIADNTVVVVMGDHPYLGSLSFNGNDHSVFFTLIDKTDPVNLGLIMSHFDVAPTVLHKLGITLKDNRMGLGSNLYSSSSYLRSMYNDQQLNKMLRKPSKTYSRLWYDDKD